MIDWLELLWQEAQAVPQVSLPERVALQARQGAGTTHNEAERMERMSTHSKKTDGEMAHLEQSRTEHLTWEREKGRMGRGGRNDSLTTLYRRVRETTFAGLPGTTAQPSAVIVREEARAVPGLTEQALDRSLRRDSRRYDGGMSIY